MNYNYDDLVFSFKQLSHDQEHEAMFISGNLARLGKGDFNSRDEHLESVLMAARVVFGENITVMTSSFTHDLIHNKQVFNTRETPTMHGAIGNFFVEHPLVSRSQHPFSSFCAIGPKAKYLCGEDLPHAYGLDSPYDKLLSLSNPLTISIGTEPNLTCSIVHHAEFQMHVPYRYIKEFSHPVVINGQVLVKNYYMHVTYLAADLERNKNVNIFTHFQKHSEIKSCQLGKGKIYSYKTKNLYESMIEQMKSNLYVWLTKEPLSKPYTQ